MEQTEQVSQIPEVSTASNQIEEKDKKETIQVPTSLVRWVCYSILFIILLAPIVILIPISFFYKAWVLCSTAAILGHFSGQINKLIDKF